MGSFCWSILVMSMIFFMAYQSSSALASEAPSRKVSTISAAPAVLPGVPLFSPALSPDITPLFPSPGGVTLPPSESSLPTIPSSRSPNPDAMAPGHDAAFPPSGSLSPSSSVSTASSGGPLNLVFLLALVAAVCIMQFPGM